MTDRPELADFLCRCRTRLAPGDVGLPPGVRRRTPGLRREEVAQLAGLSVDYYTRLEQGRGNRPSAPLLAALARALRLTARERDHLFRLAGQEPPRTTRALTHLSPALLLLLDRLHDTPAQLLSRLGDVLARNRMAVALFGDRSQQPPRERNLAWSWFTDPASRARFAPAEHERLAHGLVAELRAVRAADPDCPEGAELVAELLAASAEFTELWERPGESGAAPHAHHGTVLHPVVGAMELDCEVLRVGEGGQRLLVYTARPGSESAGRLELLQVIGSQQMTSIG
ncbi:helix-turn-helix transcriptional regulator [Kitasatospora viridis]|uniref:Helix-turn-helix protein n=1 Tax=Kitasatospora viridis TaxID=281105 RepID=A0A561SF17_9ACTN|nr:helix-turn-helix transcriptional regulator [Kitasatospora viridis]TWF73460.1 helix-turn-helix protein [Kitasatospora viridis]